VLVVEVAAVALDVVVDVVVVVAANLAVIVVVDAVATWCRRRGGSGGTGIGDGTSAGSSATSVATLSRSSATSSVIRVGPLLLSSSPLDGEKILVAVVGGVSVAASAAGENQRGGFLLLLKTRHKTTPRGQPVAPDRFFSGATCGGVRALCA